MPDGPGQPTADTRQAGSGVPDSAGTQAGTTQAGTTQAGTTQAGTTQAGTTQAGTTQAGTTQAGTTQAGTTQVTSPPTVDAAAAEGGANTTAPAKPAGPVQVTVVPGVARYHRSECILIRFLGEDDLEIMSKQEAAAKGLVACRACQPDQLPDS